MLVPEGLLMELGPATRANWNFVLGHLQPVLGEHEPVSFLALSGAVLSLLKTIIGAGAELFGFRSRRGHVGVLFLSRPLQLQSPEKSKRSRPRRASRGVLRLLSRCAHKCADWPVQAAAR